MQTDYCPDPHGWSFETFRNPSLWTRATRRHRQALPTAALAITALVMLAWLLARVIW